MAEVINAPVAAPVVSSPGASSGSTSDTGSHGSDSGSHQDSTSSETKSQGTPKSIKLSFGEGEAPMDFDLGDGSESSGPKDQAEFKFEQLDVLKDTNPDLYKTLKSELSRSSRFSKLTGFKTPEEAKGHMDRVAALEKFIGQRVDGKKGLDSIEATIGELAQDLTKIQSGDPALLQSWFKNNPIGMAQTASKIMDAWGDADPAGFVAANAKLAIAAFTAKDAGGVSAADALQALFAATKDNHEAQRLLNRVAHTVNSINDNAQYKPDQALPLQQRQAELDKKET